MTTVAVLRRAGINGGPRLHGHCRGLLSAVHLRDALSLPAAAHQDCAAPGGATGLNLAGGAEGDVVTLQHNHATMAAHAVGLQAAAVFHNTGLQTGQRIGRQNDLPIGSQNRLTVFHQGRNGRGRGGDAGQARVAAEIQRDGLTRCQHHGAGLGHDDARVDGLGGQKRDVAIEPCAQMPVIDNAACGSVAVKGGAACHESVGVNAVRGGHQAPHIDRGRGRKIQAIGVAQKHLPIGADLAVNLAGVVVQNLVERDRAGAGLVEVDLGVLSQVKGVPVDDRLGAALVDVQNGLRGRVHLGNRGRSAHHIASSGQLGQRGWGLLGKGHARHQTQGHRGNDTGHDRTA